MTPGGRPWSGGAPVRNAVPLRDRTEAGELLAAQLETYRAAKPIVLGIPRGGVPVAFEIARRLGAVLDALVVRKIGAPGDPEYGLGAVAEGGLVVVDEARAREMGVSRAELDPEIRRETSEVASRVSRFRGGRPMPDISGRVVVLVDDGVATGGTVEAAIAVARTRQPRKIVIALGVVPPDTLARLRTLADAAVAVVVPAHLEAVGQWYRHFEPVEDEEVELCLEQGRAFAPTAPVDRTGPATGLRSASGPPSSTPMP